MKKQLFLLLFVVYGISCMSPSDKLNEQAKKDSLELAIEIEARNRTEKLLNNKSKNITDDFKDSVYLDSIQIIKCYTDKPNSAGGVNVNVIWKNKSIRKIKYISFHISAFNAVEDEVFGEYNPEGFIGKSTGPFVKGKTYGNGTYWENAWYNSSITHAKIKKIKIEYMDGFIAKFKI